MGREVRGACYYEHQVTDHLQRLLDDLGLPWVRQPVAPLQDNIVTWVAGHPAQENPIQTILLEVHQDTVPVEGMTIDPWDPVVRDGCVYGRGACDVKGGMASMLTLMSRLAEEGVAGMPTVALACTVNEEYGNTGAHAVAKLWQGDQAEIPVDKPDVAIVAEPTELDVVLAHKGTLRWRCHTRGRAAHSAQPALGDNAIYRMGRVLSLLEEYARDVAPAMGDHPRVGSPTLNVGLVQGGISVNTVPDHCEIEIDRRVLPGEDLGRVHRHAIAYIAERIDDENLVQHDEPHRAIHALGDTANAALADRLRRAARQVGRGGKLIGVPYGTDAPALAEAGIPSVVFGPGSIDQAHTADEWIAVDQLHAASEILYQFVLDSSEPDGTVKTHPA
jgi:acetylornithine deacetylase